MPSIRTVLLVDDSEDDVALMHHAFAKSNFQFPIQRAANGEEAIAYFKGEGAYADRQAFPMPSMVLLDLNMPRKNGFDVLAWLQSFPAITGMVVIVLSA